MSAPLVLKYSIFKTKHCLLDAILTNNIYKSKIF